MCAGQQKLIYHKGQLIAIQISCGMYNYKAVCLILLTYKGHAETFNRFLPRKSVVSAYLKNHEISFQMKQRDRGTGSGRQLLFMKTSYTVTLGVFLPIAVISRNQN